MHGCVFSSDKGTTVQRKHSIFFDAKFAQVLLESKGDDVMPNYPCFDAY
jgi:hypothetical protein